MNIIKKGNIICFFVLLIGFLCFYIFNNSNIIFMLNIIFCFLICIKAKFSIFSLKTLLVNYVLIAATYQYNIGMSYGILQMNIYDLKFDLMMNIALIYNIIMYLFIVNTSYLIKEKQKYLFQTKFSKITCAIICAIAILSTIIAMPSISLDFSSDKRFMPLLPGNAWNHVAIICLILVMPRIKELNFIKLTYVFCIAWFLLHGERVDIIGLLFILIIMFGIKNISSLTKKTFRKYIKYIVGLLLVVFSMICIGEIRANNVIEFNNISKKILVQNTAADIAYVYNISLQYPEDFGYLNGATYIQYFKEAIPFLGNNNSPEVILNNKYGSPGGAFILGEPYMNYGFWGVIIFAIVEMFILLKIICLKGKYSFYLYIFLVATTFRSSWYGLNYIETGIIYILPVLYVVCILLDKRFKYEKK